MRNSWNFTLYNPLPEHIKLPNITKFKSIIKAFTIERCFYMNEEDGSAFDVQFSKSCAVRCLANLCNDK